MTAPSLFAGVDRALFATTYAERLRTAGLDVALTSIERCAASLEAVGPLTVADVYWVLRLSFVTRREQLHEFDAVFEVVFDAVLHLEMGWVPNRARTPPPVREDAGDTLVRLPRSPDAGAATSTALPWATLPSTGDEDAADDSDGDTDQLAVPDLQATALDLDMDRSFDLLDEAELDRLGALVESAATAWPQRRSRRHRPARSGGAIGLRRTMRTAMRTGGEVMTISRQRRKQRPRPVVVLLDVSGSMERHARAYLHLIRPLAHAHRAEVFAFATDLTRITPAIRARSSSDVVEHMNRAVGDRFSGTRVATSVRALVRHRTWSTSLRGATVLICSDGWDADEPVDLDRAMKRMSLLAHRIVWVNPRAGADGFEPHAGGMAAALPYCDEFLAGNTGRSMRDVIDAMSDERVAAQRRLKMLTPPGPTRKPTTISTMPRMTLPENS